jgi:hypothetical protein
MKMLTLIRTMHKLKKGRSTHLKSLVKNKFKKILVYNYNYNNKNNNKTKIRKIRKILILLQMKVKIILM